MNSRLYRGQVWHSRSDPAYSFRYRVWYLAADLAELALLPKKLAIFRHNRHHITSLWDRDYLLLTDDSRGAAGSATTEELVTVPRIFGHAFNPVSFLLERHDGTVTAVQAEVHNTWGERHVYTLMDQSEPGTHYASSAVKAFYVSPFLPESGGYHFELTEGNDGRLRIRIDLHDDAGERLFASGIDVTPLPLTRGNLVRLLLTIPFVNLKTVAMIHWQGVRLWLKGVTFRPNPRRTGRERKQLWHRGH